ncbi:DUF4214 domain-containing protein [Devosia sp. 919]|uniref:DUF4214 domain-containing protein n=1 Tax=Devosia sp. 919 TaxID=2726065 RepID=UPI0015518B7A|nr:DUF4214 domain-containing protein [Devosia sp. 919]
MATIQEVYIALFGRPADPAGYEFYVAATNDGEDLSAVGALSGSPEYIARFEGMGDADMVNQIFIDLFGRAADPTGLLFYVEMLRSGNASIQDIAIRIIDGATGVDQEVIENKVAAAQSFTDSLDTAEERAAYSGSDAAAQGRLFLSVVTEDDATIPTQAQVDGFISAIGSGENFDVTVALNTLAATEQAEADVLEAIALADNANETDGEAVLEGAALEGFVTGYDSGDAAIELDNAQDELFDAQADALAARQDLTAARNADSDAELSADLDAANAAIVGTADEDLLVERNETRAAFEADVAADGANVELLTDLRASIGAYVSAGGDLGALVNDAVDPVNDVTVGDLLAELNDVLSVTPVVEADVDALVDAIGEFTGFNADADVASEVALDDALDEVIQRDTLREDAAAAQTALEAGGAAADAVVAAEAAIDAREALIEADTTAQAEVAAAQDYFNQISELVDRLEAAEADVADAVAALDELGYEQPVTVDGVEAATAGNDIFLAAETNGSITGFGTDGDDLLYVGQGFRLVELEDENVGTEAVGAIGVQEIFIQQQGANTFLYIEDATFDGSATDGSFDGTIIQLSGVNAEDVSFANGYFSIA